MVITIYAFSTSSSTASSYSLIWETLVMYDCMVSAFWIFTFFNWFLKVIFQFMFFPSNILVKESNISLDVFREDTCGIRWSLIESIIILLTLTKFFLCKALASSPSRTGTSPLMCRCPIHFLQELVKSYTSMLGICQFHQDGVISHHEMRTSTVNSKRLDLTDLMCPSWFRSWLI